RVRWLVVRLVLADFLMIAQGKRHRPAVKAVRSARGDEDRVHGRVARHDDLDGADAVDVRPSEGNCHLRAAPGGHGNGSGRTGKVADAEAVPEVVAAMPHGITHLDQVVAAILERVRQAGVRLESGGIIVMPAGKFATGARVEQSNL